MTSLISMKRTEEHWELGTWFVRVLAVKTSHLLRRFVFRIAEASAKRVTGDEPQGTMGRVQTAGLARCLLPAFLCAHVLKRDVWVRDSVKTEPV